MCTQACGQVLLHTVPKVIAAALNNNRGTARKGQVGQTLLVRIFHHQETVLMLTSSTRPTLES
jgi:hypothetical protein